MVRVSASLRDCHAARFRISSPPHAPSARSANGRLSGRSRSTT
jgi:hypothetical protein